MERKKPIEGFSAVGLGSRRSERTPKGFGCTCFLGSCCDRKSKRRRKRGGNESRRVRNRERKRERRVSVTGRGSLKRNNTSFPFFF
jgi:hypothetical protein